MTGLAFHDELVRTGVLLAVIFVSGHADVPTSVRAMKAGALPDLVRMADRLGLHDAGSPIRKS